MCYVLLIGIHIYYDIILGWFGDFSHRGGGRKRIHTARGLEKCRKD